MGPDQHNTAPLRPLRVLRHGSAGLTLVEVMVASAMIALTCTTFMFVFNQINNMAMINRLYTGAAAIAQTQIDTFSTTAFTPTSNPPVIPAILAPGTTSTTVNVYHDPVSNVAISGTMTTTTVSADSSYTNGSLNDTLYLRQTTVVVSYSYRSRTYSVSYSTMRTSDI